MLFERPPRLPSRKPRAIALMSFSFFFAKLRSESRLTSKIRRKKDASDVRENFILTADCVESFFVELETELKTDKTD